MKTNVTSRKLSGLKLILVFAATFSLFPPVIYSQAPADFSGTWKLDISKSTELPGLVSATLVITQKGNDIKIERTFETKDRDPILTTFNYTIGNQSEYSSQTGITKVTASWSSDKNNFSVIETVISDKFGSQRQVKKTTVYSLTNRGKTLSVICDDTVPRESPELENKRHMEFFYDKS